MQHDQEYLEIILRAIRVCARYKPKLGLGGDVGLTLREFQTAYSADSFYSWFGLENPLMYAAHKAAGGMTSIYRQIGTGCERLIQKILQDQLGLSPEHIKWSYEVDIGKAKKKKLSLDGRIPFEEIKDKNRKKLLLTWLSQYCETLKIDPAISKQLKGIVFEVRQGYKSKDSKRQNADIANAVTAYTMAYFPCVMVMSNQIDVDIVHRYRVEKWGIITGLPKNSSTQLSTYSFFDEVVGYDLQSFFERNADKLRKEIDIVLKALLAPEK